MYPFNERWDYKLVAQVVCDVVSLEPVDMGFVLKAAASTDLDSNPVIPNVHEPSTSLDVQLCLLNLNELKSSRNIRYSRDAFSASYFTEHSSFHSPFLFYPKHYDQINRYICSPIFLISLTKLADAASLSRKFNVSKGSRITRKLPFFHNPSSIV